MCTVQGERLDDWRPNNLYFQRENGSICKPIHYQVHAELQQTPVYIHCSCSVCYVWNSIQALADSKNSSKIDTKKLDGISANVLKNDDPNLPLSSFISTKFPMTVIFFSNGWKTAWVQSVAKRGKKSLPANYRSISILSKVMNKWYEFRQCKYIVHSGPNVVCYASLEFHWETKV